jgi:hypothetical protein
VRREVRPRDVVSADQHRGSGSREAQLILHPAARHNRRDTKHAAALLSRARRLRTRSVAVVRLAGRRISSWHPSRAPRWRTRRSALRARPRLRRASPGPVRAGGARSRSTASRRRRATPQEATSVHHGPEGPETSSQVNRHPAWSGDQAGPRPTLRR